MLAEREREIDALSMERDHLAQATAHTQREREQEEDGFGRLPPA